MYFLWAENPWYMELIYGGYMTRRDFLKSVAYFLLSLPFISLLRNKTKLDTSKTTPYPARHYKDLAG